MGIEQPTNWEKRWRVTEGKPRNHRFEKLSFLVVCVTI